MTSCRVDGSGFYQHRHRGVMSLLVANPGHGVKLLGRLPCVQKFQVSIPARRMVPFFGGNGIVIVRLAEWPVPLWGLSEG
jgi:hypothetical protein